LPGALQSKMGVIPLFRCKEKTGPRYLITTSSTCSTGPGPAAYDPQGKEGYIYPLSPAPEPELESAPLFLFKQTGGGGFATSTVRPDGYDEGSKVLLGHLPMRSRLGYRFH
ncbi:MAG TPA: hypothetical protein VFB81_13655, partial [Myxococcales bacterium]|nr:hypothetical protein [Myxococcales bacterium]